MGFAGYDWQAGTRQQGRVEFDPMKADTGEMTSVSGASQFGNVANAVAVPTTAAPPRRFDLSALPMQTRAEQIAATLDNAFRDDRFRDHVTLADAARDRGDWVMAELEYGNALRRFPLHWGYCIQFAHAVKEQQHYVLAEVWYRSAVALGAPAEMVDQHLAFVARLNGSDFVRDCDPRLDVPPMQAPPTVHDIRVLGGVTRVPGLAGEDLALHLLRTAPDNRAVLLHMLDMPGFVQSNRAFLAILGA